jgi:hypothetical protein
MAIPRPRPVSPYAYRAPRSIFVNHMSVISRTILNREGYRELPIQRGFV